VKDVLEFPELVGRDLTVRIKLIEPFEDLAEAWSVFWVEYQTFADDLVIEPLWTELWPFQAIACQSEVERGSSALSVDARSKGGRKYRCRRPQRPEVVSFPSREFAQTRRSPTG